MRDPQWRVDAERRVQLSSRRPHLARGKVRGGLLCLTIEATQDERRLAVASHRRTFDPRCSPETEGVWRIGEPDDEREAAASWHVDTMHRIEPMHEAVAGLQVQVAT